MVQSEQVKLWPVTSADYHFATCRYHDFRCSNDLEQNVVWWRHRTLALVVCLSWVLHG